MTTMSVHHAMFCVVLLSCLSWAWSANLDCSTNPCHNGGSCNPNSPICSCPPRFSGSLCKTKTGCPRGLTHIQVLGGCVGYVMPWTNRTNAGAVCQKGGAKLVNLSNLGKYYVTSFHVQQFTGTGFWVDASFSNGAWTWVDGTVMDSTTFADDISTGPNKCLVLSFNSRFYIVDCKSRFLALCEADWIDPNA